MGNWLAIVDLINFLRSVHLNQLKQHLCDKIKLAIVKEGSS